MGPASLVGHALVCLFFDKRLIRVVHSISPRARRSKSSCVRAVLVHRAEGHRDDSPNSQKWNEDQLVLEGTSRAFSEEC